MDLGQIFENSFDCYADTWQDENGKMIEGDVVLAMTKEKFIEVVNNQRELLLAVICEYNKINTQKEIIEVEKWIEKWDYGYIN